MENPIQNPQPQDNVKSSVPTIQPKNSPGPLVGEMDSETMEYLGFPTPEQQQRYDETRITINKRRDEIFNKPFVRPIDPTKLSEDGRSLRRRVGGVDTVTNRNVSRVDAILGRINNLRKPGRMQALPFDEAQFIVQAIYENDLANRARTPYWTEETFKVVDDVTKYFIGDPTGPISLTKNLYVYGAVGVGKTYLFRMMSILCDVVPINEMRFSMVGSKRLMRTIKNDQSLKALSRIDQGNWLIDDLGAEKRWTKLYAEDVDPMDELINSVYEAYIDNGKKTHWTSNKEPDELEAIYGTRNYDRFTEMNESVFFPGESIRIDPNQVDEETDEQE
ncbi:P-loop NTPase family protein [Spirosoma validum]|uniref:Uncharacterized protein n=1 Tax=Spirosoma validum TaxID=2771355 RepID=A0A927GDR1_9BACT|nr:hypothetical protein [Spirosoma validum]MBD2753820.1 hypothetical protein [Spirosoma validum]